MTEMCGYCSSATLEAFFFSGPKKVPVCHDHLSIVFCDKFSKPPRLYPFPAIHFMDKPADFATYTAKKKEIQQRKDWLTAVQREETKQWETVVLELKRLHQDVIDEAKVTFQQQIEKLQKYHEQLTNRLGGVAQEFDRSVLEKCAELTPLAAHLFAVGRPGRWGVLL